jgi:uncharacterized protein YpiB (UPF0302 family)
MRIKFTSEAEQAFEALVSDTMKMNPFIERDNSRWLSAIVTVFKRGQTRKMHDELIEALSTHESLRRSLLQQIEQASLGMDVEAIRAFEAGIKKLNKKGGEQGDETAK